jgi:hypothetical protein
MKSILFALLFGAVLAQADDLRGQQSAVFSPDDGKLIAGGGFEPPTSTWLSEYFIDKNVLGTFEDSSVRKQHDAVNFSCGLRLRLSMTKTKNPPRPPGLI